MDATTGFGGVTWRLALLGVGMGLTMAPATESIMGSLPLARAGVGSAVNDTTRELGGAVGVAVIGSVFSSVYGSKIVDALHGRRRARHRREGSVGAALAIAAKLPGAAGRAFAEIAQHAFVDGFHTALLVAAATTVAGLVAVLAFLPARPSRPTSNVRPRSSPRSGSAELAPGEPGAPDLIRRKRGARPARGE